MSAPRLVVTLSARTVDEARLQVEIARTAGADLAEIRVDRWAEEERGRVRELFPSALPLLATLRSRAEGGEGPDEPDERAREIRRLAALPFEGLDLERARDLPLLEVGSARPRRTQVVSVHLPEGVLPSAVDAGLRPSEGGSVVGKVVLPADVRTALKELIPRIPPALEGPRLLLTTGGSGALLRAWARRLEFPLVYASLPTAAGPPVEPSQIPADVLRAFLDGPEDAPIFAITGHPVAHSQSPYLHARWMRAAHHPGLYIPLDITSESEFLYALPFLVEGGFRGLNVTHPWKTIALKSADDVSRAAERCGVANCLTLGADGVVADNTDLAAILRRLGELRESGRWDGRELAVVGSGGAAAATLAAAADLGAVAHVLGRDPDRTGHLARRFGASALASEDARPFSLVVHATPVGRADAGELALPIDRLVAPGGTLLDWVYSPESPTVRRQADRGGATYEDGWRLLVYQAAASFGVWWGEPPPETEIVATVEEGPCAA